MTIFVTGSAGLLGEALKDAGCNGLSGDMTDVLFADKLVRALCLHYGTDFALVNCAGKTNVDWCEDHPVESLGPNTAIPIILTRLLKKYGKGAPLFVQLSTDFIFDGRYGPYAEEENAAPLSVYGAQKWMAEKIVAQYPNHMIVRTTGLFGNHDTKRTFVHWVLKGLAPVQREQLPVYGGQKTTPTYAPWLANKIKWLCGTRHPALINITSGQVMARYDWAVKIAEAWDIRDIHRRLRPTGVLPYQKARRPEWGGLKIEKLKSYNLPITTVEESLREMRKTWKG